MAQIVNVGFAVSSHLYKLFSTIHQIKFQKSLLAAPKSYYHPPSL